ncbi:hypothetical protein DFH29DRAFT_879561 [Suillus ampliporus]|nr:hypothetical protein DFH29DRAFT_879561 [Suillus ampliporus]
MTHMKQISCKTVGGTAKHGCQEVRDKCAVNSTTTPYFGFEDRKGNPVLEKPASLNTHIELTSWFKTCSAPILILNFILKGIDPFGSPARIMQALLQPYITTEALHYHKIGRHVKSMEKLVDELGRCKFDHVEIFVHSHSETTRGDIWGGSESVVSVGNGKIKVEKPVPIAYIVDNFFAGVFVAGLEEILKGATLWMLVCGHMHAFAFGAEGFHCLTAPFITAYVKHVLVEGFLVQEVILSLLAVCPWLTRHTSVIHVYIPNAFCRRLPTIIEFNKGELHVDDIVPGATHYCFNAQAASPSVAGYLVYSRLSGNQHKWEAVKTEL